MKNTLSGGEHLEYDVNKKWLLFWGILSFFLFLWEQCGADFFMFYVPSACLLCPKDETNLPKAGHACYSCVVTYNILWP